MRKLLVGLALLVVIFSSAACSLSKPPIQPVANATPGGTSQAPSSAPEPTPATETTFNDAHDFSEGVAWVQVEKDGNWSCIDGSGTVRFSLGADEFPVTDFIDGGAVVQTGYQDQSKVIRLVDKGGNTVFPSADDKNVYIYVGSTLGDTAVARTVNSIRVTETQDGILDSSGKWIVEPTGELILGDQTVFGYGILPVGDGPGGGSYKNYRYYDAHTNSFFSEAPGTDYLRLEKHIIPYLYHEDLAFLAHDPSGFLNLPGYASMPDLGFKADKTGFYNRNKKLVIDLSGYPRGVYPRGDFSGGYCSLDLWNPQQNQFSVIIDKTGKEMFEPVAGGGIGAFSQGLAFMDMTQDGGQNQNGDSYYMDATGTKVITGLETGFPFADNGLARVKLAGADGFSFIDTTGKTAF